MKNWVIKYVSQLKSNYCFTKSELRPVCNSVLRDKAPHHEKRNRWKEIGDIVVARHTTMPSGEQFGLITHNKGPFLGQKQRVTVPF